MSTWTKKLSVALVVVLALSLGASAAFAQGGPGRQGQGPLDCGNCIGLRLGGARLLIEALADAAEIEPSDVLQEARDGATLTEIAEAHGVDPQAVIDAALADATERMGQAVENERITQEQADEILAEAGTFFADAMTQTLPNARQAAIQVRVGVALVNAVSEATDLDRLEIVQQLRDGSTLAEIAEANGGDVNAIVADVAAQIAERINEAVENGNLTQERADEILSTLEADLQEAMTTVHDFQGMFGGNFGPMMGQPGGMFGGRMGPQGGPGGMMGNQGGPMGPRGGQGGPGGGIF